MSDITVNVIDVNEQNFQQVLLEESTRRLVVVDFWAEWCSHCKVLMPILEKLAEEYNGQILLAKVNADEQQAITAQFGVRSLPTVAIMKDGQPIDGFAGAEPESAIRERLNQHLPAPWEADVKAAMELMQQGQNDQALALLRGAYTVSNEEFAIGLLIAECYLNLKRSKEASEILAAATMEQQLEPKYAELVSRLELMQEAADTPAIVELQQKLASQPDNLALKVELAVQYSQAERVEEALQTIYEVVQKDKNYQDGAARKTMLDILNSLGKGDPLAIQYQRKLFTLMY
ncbi:thioredoxin [Reinekea thalattae]|uniref:Thioredoxin n=1 Tax=Reinekea thalattae TaxID=2593301 RepID=A0A5C8Z7N2_9GAMM|nr:thioredoxin [Reinekea thalattae]TXR54095.1 thioredoxin [Reinekea thalattae]